MVVQVRLVAISKLHPPSSILALHAPSSSSSSSSCTTTTNHSCHSHFGESYVQELAAKAAVLPRSIHWHFVGGLQTNKCAALTRVPALWCVSSVDTAKKANALDRGWRDARAERRRQPSSTSSSSAAASTSICSSTTATDKKNDADDDGHEDDDDRLRIHVQVNTSHEPQKAGVPGADDAAALCAHVVRACPSLRLLGLMAIGAPPAAPPDHAPDADGDDFARLRAVRDDVARQLRDMAAADGGEGDEGEGEAVEGSRRWPTYLELSMGMSGDFETAVRAGSDEVRVGTGVFGERPPKDEAAEMRAAELGR